METDTSIPAEIRRLEIRLLDPRVRSSPEQLCRLLADDFVEFGSSGLVYNRDEIIRALQQGTGVEYSLHGFQARSLGPGVVLATYRAVRFSAGGDSAEHSLRSSIWKHVGGRWQLVFHQGTATAG
jgi:hypothetical protein